MSSGSLIVFGVTVLMARRVEVSEFGRYGFVVAYLPFFRLIGSIGLVPVLVREFARAGGGAESLAGTALTLKVVLTALAAALAAAVVRIVSDDPGVVAATLVGSLSLISVLGDVHMAFLQARNRLQLVTLAETSQLIVWGGLGAVALLSGGGVLELLWALVVGHVVQLVVLLLSCGRSIPLRLAFDTSVAWRLIRRAVPLAAMAAFSIVLLRLDVLMLYAMRGEEDVALYWAGVRLAQPWLLFATAFTAAIFPQLCVWYSQDPATFGAVYRLAFKYLFAFILPVAVGLSLVAPELLPAVYGPNYVPGATSFAILIVAHVFFFLEQFNAYLLIASDRQNLASAYTIVAGVLNIGANLVLIPRFGIEGAALASLIAYGSYFLVQAAVPGSRPFALSIVQGSPRALIAAAVMGLLIAGPLEGRLLPSLLIAPIAYLGTLLILRGVDFRELRLLARSAERSPVPAEVADRV